LATLRQAQKLARPQRAADREQVADFFRRTIESRTIILDEAMVPVAANKAEADLTDIEAIVAELFKDKAAELMRRYARLLLEPLDGPKQGPVGALKHFQSRGIFVCA
jgi:hypothetical protein